MAVDFPQNLERLLINWKKILKINFPVTSATSWRRSLLILHHV